MDNVELSKKPEKISGGGGSNLNWTGITPTGGGGGGGGRRWC